MKKFSVILLVILFPTLSPAAWNEPDGFRGLKWGSPAAELRGLFPAVKEYTKSRHVKSFLGDRMRMFSVKDKIGDLPITIDFYYLDNRFDSANLRFNSESFLTLSTAFKEAYGPPHSETRSVVKSGLGVEYRKIEMFWSGPDVSIYLTKYSDKITEGSVSIGKKAGGDYLLQVQNQRASRAAKALRSSPAQSPSTISLCDNFQSHVERERCEQRRLKYLRSLGNP